MFADNTINIVSGINDRELESSYLLALNQVTIWVNVNKLRINDKRLTVRTMTL